MNCEPYYFPRQGVIKLDFTNEDLLSLKKEINQIMNNMLKSDPFNQQLAGHINHEYILKDSRLDIENLLIPGIQEYTKNFGFPVYINDILSKDVPFELDKLWVNFQKKYEFNPVHFHGGIFSFVIWIDIPYTKEDEGNIFEKMSDIHKVNGNFSFVYCNILGMIVHENISADNLFEGKGFLFPSMLNHCVYPFFSSDKYRISVSGNIKLKV